MDNNLTSFDADSDDEYDWEEVDVSTVQPRTIEITLSAQTKPEEPKRKSGISHEERILRLNCHKIHTVALLANAGIRNRWVNDELLHARLLSLCPLKLQNAFAVIHKSRIPDARQRGRMFETAMRDLTNWWSASFEIELEGHIRNRTFDEIQQVLEQYQLLVNEDDCPESEMDLEVLQDVMDEDMEVIRSPKSLMKHALLAIGTRDTSAQLFTALCRALGIPARLVVSLQSVPWQASIGRSRPNYTRRVSGKGKGKDSSTENASQASEHEESIEDEDVEDVQNPSTSTPIYDVKGKGKAKSFPDTGYRLDEASTSKGKEKAKPPIKLRKARPQRRVLGSVSPSVSVASDLYRDDLTLGPPVFWTEVFSKPDGRWLPVDPIRSIVNNRKVFDPTPVSNGNINATANAAVAQFSRFNSPAPNKRHSWTPLRQDNRLLYVLAFEEDGYARDVTRRYAREYNTKVAKAQGGSGAANMGRGGQGRTAWWNRVLGLVRRPYRLNRDDVEDEELDTVQMLEGMPTTMAGFKDHPVYVLERHLKQNETIHPAPPSTPELGKFRGEPVYPRFAVVSLKSAESWMRNEGRTVKVGEQPLKMVKVRAGTVNKLRELEVLKEAAGTNGESQGGEGEAMQGLYARSQTEVYVPNPVVDGIVPKNNFGNIDLYTPSMLPQGAAHIPYKGIAKIVRKLGFDFAEAVTGFEFKKRRAFPVIEGVVIAKENEGALLEAYWEYERVAEEKARVKREERVIKRWTRLIQGLRIRQRLQEQYGTKTDRAIAAASGSVTAEGRVEKDSKGDGGKKKEGMGTRDIDEMDLSGGAGGFLIGADDVVEAFHLPKNRYIPDQQPVQSAQPASSNHHHHHQDGDVNDDDLGGKWNLVAEGETIEQMNSVQPAGTEVEVEAVPEFITYDLDDHDDEDVHGINNEVKVSFNTGLHQHQNQNIDMDEDRTTIMTGPKSMAELALEAENRMRTRESEEAEGQEQTVTITATDTVSATSQKRRRTCSRSPTRSTRMTTKIRRISGGRQQLRGDDDVVDDHDSDADADGNDEDHGHAIEGDVAPDNEDGEYNDNRTTRRKTRKKTENSSLASTRERREATNMTRPQTRHRSNRVTTSTNTSTSTSTRTLRPRRSKA